MRSPGSWPVLQLEQQVGELAVTDTSVGTDRAEIRLVSGSLVLERSDLRAVFTLPRRLTAEELVHPYLAPAAAVAARWLGRESFHGGAFVSNGGIWAVLGKRGAGKSSLLAWLNSQNVRVYADDAIILDGSEAFAGPRSVDLRGDAATRLQLGDALGIVGQRERWRLRLDEVPPSLPLRGWIFLEWAEETQITPLSASACFSGLVAHRMVRLAPEQPEVLLDYADLPAWRLRRRRGWQTIGEGMLRLLDHIS